MTAAVQTSTLPDPDPLVRTRERLRNMTLAEVKAHTDARLGRANEHEIDGRPAGSLRMKSAAADGGPEVWRIFYEWEPAS